MQETPELPIIEATLVFPISGNNVLLALGKPDKKIGANCRNGYGGKNEAGESAVECIMRELPEESGGVTVSAGDVKQVASVDFYNEKKNGTKFICRVQVFTMHVWKGSFKGSAEMLSPSWFSIDHLPFGEMMVGDGDWVPQILDNRGRKFKVTVWYDGPGEKKLLKPTEIVEVETLD